MFDDSLVMKENIYNGFIGYFADVTGSENAVLCFSYGNVPSSTRCQL